MRAAQFGLFSVAALSCALLCGTAAEAGPIPGVTISVSTPGVATLEPGGLDNGDGTFSYLGGLASADWDLEWDMVVDPDPFVSGDFSLVNNTAFTQPYVLTVSLPIFPAVTPASLMGGSLGVTVTDANFNGTATVATLPGIPFYSGLIDGVEVLTLLDAPFSLSAPFPGGTATASDFAGLPGPSIPGPIALTSIDITLRFTLTPGDRIGITSFFIVEPVPEPSTVILALIGGVSLAGVSLRRKRK